ncbi:hypothetical protein AQJ23_17165 [Streptomyces antibioticus]|nr:hypothetical protein AQJ23_17165 [Streptomyces antibioticus]
MQGVVLEPGDQVEQAQPTVPRRLHGDAHRGFGVDRRVRIALVGASVDIECTVMTGSDRGAGAMGPRRG